MKNKEMENLTLEERAMIGEAFIWAIGEGIISNLAIKPLVEKYKANKEAIK